MGVQFSRNRTRFLDQELSMNCFVKMVLIICSLESCELARSGASLVLALTERRINLTWRRQIEIPAFLWTKKEVKGNGENSIKASDDAEKKFCSCISVDIIQ